MNLKSSFSSYGFIWGIALLNLMLAVYATPVAFLDDTTDYIMLAESFLGQPAEVNLEHRSPLFSIILAGFMLFFKPMLLYKVMVFFQYFLVALTSLMVYWLFQRIFSRKIFSIATALAFNLSFATICYANIMLTEILTVFLLVLSVVFLMKIHDEGKWSQYAALGAAVGLLALARYNTVPLIATFVALLVVVEVLRKRPARKWVTSLGGFFLTYLLFINAWCLYNWTHNGFYGLFPNGGGSVSRNTIVNSIRADDVVSEANQPILDIFLEARTQYLEEAMPKYKGSLQGLDKFDFLRTLYGGYQIYLNAVPKLRRHFELPASSGEHDLSLLLQDFYQEISSQNKGYILKARFFSFLNGFRASTGGALPASYGNANLNFLPPVAFKLYKLAFLGVTFTVFFAFFFFAAEVIKNGWRFNFTLLAMFFIIFSFWGINFVFATGGDASRFKFPAEPFLFGLFLFYLIQVLNWIKHKVPRRQEQRTKVAVR